MSNGKPTDATRGPSLDGERIAELERQLAAVSTQNAGLMRANQEAIDVRRQLQGLLDNIPDRIYFKDTQSRFLRLNQPLAKRLGVADPEQAVGKSDFDFQLPERAREFYADEQRVMQTGEALINKTEKQVLPDGKTAWTATTKAPLRDTEGKIVGLVGINRDITLQKQAEAGLASEQELFHTLLETFPDNVYFKDRESRIVRVSRSKVESTLQSARKLHRAAHPNDNPDAWPPHLAEASAFGDWLIGKTDFDTFPGDHARKTIAEEQEIIRTGQPMIGVIEKTTQGDGSSNWWLTTKLPWRDKDGNIIGIFGVTRNVTELKETEVALARERLLLRALIDNLPDAIYAKDTAGRKTLANPADLKNLRCQTEAEAIGKSDFDLFPKDLAEKFMADDLKVIGGQPVINREEYFLDDQGAKRWLLTSKLPLRNPEGRIVGLIGIGRDITLQKQVEDALRQSEERLQEVLRSTRCILNSGEAEAPEDWRERVMHELTIFRWDYSVMNEEAAQEVLPLNVPPGKNYQQAWVESRNVDDFNHMHQVTRDAFLQDKPFYRNEFRCTDKDGIEHWMQEFITIRKLGNNHWHLFGITTDITDLKKSEMALRSSEETLRQFTVQLERSNRELQDFAYVASHDLQEPLRKIVVFGERLKEKNADTFEPQSLDYLDRMQKSAGRMQTLINDLLSFSRITTKAQPFAAVNLAEVAVGVVEDLEGRIELVKGRVELGALPVIDAEPLQMRQLLQNLIGNALKFRRPEEPPVVKVEAQLLPDPDTPDRQLCRLTVSDNCIGFDEKYVDRIFNVFQRLHTRNEYEGTGMGLAIVRKIALYHGGDITAKSKPGVGSTFIVTVPVAHPQKPEIKTASRASAPP
jgi:PAS domain S-box-containing protein